jgi:hypothetical protein
MFQQPDQESVEDYSMCLWNMSNRSSIMTIPYTNTLTTRYKQSSITTINRSTEERERIHTRVMLKQSHRVGPTNRIQSMQNLTKKSQSTYARVTNIVNEASTYTCMTSKLPDTLFSIEVP